MSPKFALNLLQQDANACWFVEDRTLASFVQNRALLARAQAEAEAELVARWWVRRSPKHACSVPLLLNQHSEEWQQFLADIARDFHEEETFGPLRLTEGRPTDTFHWSKCLRSRLGRFLNAHGFIALTTGASGCLLPFEVQHAASDQWRFVDMWGVRVVPEWTEVAAELDGQVSRAPYQILLNGVLLAPVELTGESFGLPVALAALFQDIPGFDPSKLVATGAVKDGCLVRVSGCEMKRAAAVRLGARLFVCPACELEPREDIHTLQIPCGATLGAAKTIVEEKLRKMGLLPMDAPRAVELIRNVLAAGDVGPGNPAVSIPLIRNAVTVLSETLSQPGQTRPEKLARHVRDARLHLASLYNHAGDPCAAKQVLEELLLSGGPTGAATDRAFCEASVRLIVSLSDEGRFSEAEDIARNALESTASLSESEETDQRVRMELYGAVGCDLLPQQFLRLGPAIAGEVLQKAFEYQTTNLRLARELQYAQLPNFNGNQNLAKSAVRSALLPALLNPVETEDRVAEVLRECADLPGWEESAPYLARIRFLGEYRRQLFADGQPGRLGWEDQVPKVMSAGGEWVRATALKYRAAIRAREQRLEEAAADFSNALRLLGSQPAPVIRLLRWSIAAEAWCSLPETLPRVGEVIISDRMVAVEYLERYGPSQGLAERIKKADLTAVQNSEAVDALREFQRSFAY